MFLQTQGFSAKPGAARRLAALQYGISLAIRAVVVDLHHRQRPGRPSRGHDLEGQRLGGLRDIPVCRRNPAWRVLKVEGPTTKAKPKRPTYVRASGKRCNNTGEHHSPVFVVAQVRRRLVLFVCRA
jgi:hypothetical protein